MTLSFPLDLWWGSYLGVVTCLTTTRFCTILLAKQLYFLPFSAFQQSYGTNVTIEDKDGKLCLYAELMVNFSVSYQQNDSKVSQGVLWAATRDYWGQALSYISFKRLAKQVRWFVQMKCWNVEMWSWILKRAAPLKRFWFFLAVGLHSFFLVQFLLIFQSVAHQKSARIVS